MADDRLLVGDIGGTNARFAVAQSDGTLTDIRILAVADHPQFTDALSAYIAGLGETPPMMAIASAGFRDGDRVTLTNAPWTLGEADLQSSHGFQSVKIFNDFEAQARFAGGAPDSAKTVLKEGTPVVGAPIVTVGPGTGFGQALFLPGEPPRVVPSEGGHRLLPMRTERDWQFSRRLEGEKGRPAILEEALSGRGLVTLYRFCAGLQPPYKEDRLPEDVTAVALKSAGPEREAVLWFLELLATASADACFSTGARGGVAIAGGITPKLMPLLQHTDFRANFCRNGPLLAYLEAVPVWLITEPHAALYGVSLLFQDVHA